MSFEQDQAIHLLEQQTRDFPGERRHFILLARHLLQAGRTEEASAAAKAALAIDAEDPAPHLLLVESLLRRNRPGSAGEAIDRALRTARDDAELLAKAGEVRHLSGRLPEAEQYFRRALSLAPRNTRLRFQYARLVLAQCRYREAIEQYSELSRGRFFRDEAFAGIALAQERLGDIDCARHHMELALEAGRKPSAFVLQTLADIALQTGELESAISALEAGLQGTGFSGHDRAGLHFSLARMLDRKGEYGDAFAHFKLANELLKPEADWRSLGGRCRALKEKFSGHAVDSMPRAAHGDGRPVFIVGLPRSGTSLAESVLAAHPAVHGAGELDAVRRIAMEVERLTGCGDAGPVELGGLGQEEIDRLAARYLVSLDSLSLDAGRIVDKMPGNLMYLGLITALFPDARVIHCVRNPLDTCLSCYFQRFHGSNSLAYTFDLEALAYTWQQQERLMAHWKSVLPIPIMDLVYEDFVHDFEATARSMLEFCGLEWDAAVLRHHESGNECHTASYAQVRRPVYGSSVDRWRNYEPYIRPLMEQLGCDG